MKRTTVVLSLLLAMGAMGCDDDDKPKVTSSDAAPVGAGNTGDGGASPDTGAEAAFVLTEWVHDLVTKHTNQSSDPDTVDDKQGRLQITEDPAAFDPILEQR